jgi:hypothetical protein
MKNIIIFITILLGLSLAANCKTASKEILTRDYMAMSDDDLLRYFYDLDDEIAKCEKKSGGSSVGLGTGIGIGPVGIGLGASRGISGCKTDELRKRRTEVRMQLKKKEINP